MKYAIQLVAFCLIYIGIFHSSLAQNRQLEYEVDGQLFSAEERMEQANIRGMSIAVIQNGKVDTVMSYGMADPTQGTAVNPHTLFQAGTVTTTATAILVLRAVEQKLVDLDTDINEYLRSWKLPQKHTKNDPVTIRQLLLKQRGFKQNSKSSGYFPHEAVPTLIQVLNGIAPAKNSPIYLRSATHKQDNYSFETEVILQQILEDVYQQSFSEIIQEQLFDIVGMKESICQLRLSQEQKTRASIGFTPEGQPIEGLRILYPELASSGIWTTTTDYAKFICAIMNDANQDSQILLSQEMMHKALKPFHNGKAFTMNRYGDSGDCHYGGASVGFRTQFLMHPEQQWGYVVFMNSHENWKFMGETLYRLKLAFGTPLKN